MFSNEVGMPRVGNHGFYTRLVFKRGCLTLVFKRGWEQSHMILGPGGVGVARRVFGRAGVN